MFMLFIAISAQGAVLRWICAEMVIEEHTGKWRDQKRKFIFDKFYIEYMDEKRK